MSVYAELPDGRKLEFPDGTDPAVIQNTVKKVLGKSAQPPSKEWMRRAAISATRGENPGLAKTIDFGTGASGMLRGALNLLPGDPGDALLTPEYADKGSGAHLAGALFDPGAWAIGGAVGKAIPYAPVLGRGAVEGIKAVGRNLGGGAIAGGAIGGLSDEGSVAGGASIGALGNALLPPAVNALYRTPSAIRNFLAPSGAQLAVRAAGEKTDDVIAAMQQAQSGVPGMEYNAAQAAVPANSAEFSALQRLAARENPSLYSGPQGIYGQQQTARQSAVRSIGKTPADLTAAKQARSAASAVAYDKAFAVSVKADPALLAMSRNPYYAAAARDALKLAKAEGISPNTDLTRFLHLVKLSMDDTLQKGKAGATALGDTERRAILDAQRNLVSWLTKRNPAYGAARAGHEAASKPITQMKLGQELEQALVAPTGGERATQFAGAVRKAGSQTSKATGKPRIEALDQQQQQLLGAITDDLTRDATWKRLAQEGQKNMLDRVGAWQAPPTGFFAPLVSAARSWFNRATGNLTEQGLTELADLMARDPKKLAVMMQKFSPSQRKAVQAVIQQKMAPAIGGLVSGAQQ